MALNRRFSRLGSGRDGPGQCSFLLPAICWVLLGARALAGIQATFFVSPSGVDTDPGTSIQPFQTLYRAKAAVRSINANMSGDIQVYLRQGVYVLSNTLSFGPVDSGNHGFRIVYSAYPGETAVISGGKVISGWTLHDASRNIWKASVEPTDNFRQLYVNGIKATRSRSAGPPAGWALTSTGYTTTDTNLQHFGNLTNLEVVASPHEWSQERLPVASVQGSVITLQEPCRSIAGNGPNLGFDNPVWLENAYEFLTTPGYWYLDLASHVLYYLPRSWENLATATVEAPVVEELLLLDGSATNPVSNLTFTGLTFRLSNWLQPSTSLGMPTVQANQSWPPYEDWYVKAAVECLGARNIEIRSCVFRELGGNGVNFLTASQDDLVSDCRFFSLASCSVQVALARSTVEAQLPPDSGDIVSGIVLSNCVIHDVCTDYQAGCGIFAGYCRACSFVNNDIYNLPGIALSLGWGWGAPGWSASYSGENQIIRNRIYNHTQVLADGGGIYCLGEQSPGGFISNNYVYSQGGGFGHIYLDEGANNWTVTSNVCEWATANCWYFYKGSNNVANGNFTDSAVVLNWGISNLLINTTLVPDRIWPPAAVGIMQAAGSSLAGLPNSGMFTNTHGGVWGDARNWNANVIADGPDETADCSGFSLTADTTVFLDENHTVGKIVFADIAASHDWILDPAGQVLTLLATTNTPVIVVNNRSAIVNASLVGPVGMTKQGNGTLMLSGRNPYLTGSTVVSQGDLIVNGSLSANNLVTVLSNATLGGTGTVAGPITVNGIIGTGETIGTLTTGAETWNGGGAYLCKISGTNVSDCDRLGMNGNLNLQVASGETFTIKLVSLTSSNTPGLIDCFDPAAAYAWPIATVAGAVQNFAADQLAVNTLGFSNRFTGVFGITTNANGVLLLIYTPPTLIPPSIVSRKLMPGGVFQMSFSGPVGQPFRVIGTNKLSAPPPTWPTLSQGTIGVGGVESFTDPGVGSNQQRFYRIVSP